MELAEVSDKARTDVEHGPPETPAHRSSFRDDVTTIDLLAQRWWKFIYANLRGRGYSSDQAKDLTQGFFADVLLRDKKLWKAVAAGDSAQLRGLLRVVIVRYLIRVRRSQAAQRRIPHSRLIRIDTEHGLLAAHIRPGAPSEGTLDYTEASEVLKRVLRDVEVECHETGRALYWRLFLDRVLIPMEDRDAIPSLEDLCQKYGVADVRRASNMIVTVKRSLKRALIRHLRTAAASQDEALDELREMRLILARVPRRSG